MKCFSVIEIERVVKKVPPEDRQYIILSIFGRDFFECIFSILGD